MEFLTNIFRTLVSNTLKLLLYLKLLLAFVEKGFAIDVGVGKISN